MTGKLVPVFFAFGNHEEVLDCLTLNVVTVVLIARWIRHLCWFEGVLHSGGLLCIWKMRENRCLGCRGPAQILQPVHQAAHHATVSHHRRLNSGGRGGKNDTRAMIVSEKATEWTTMRRPSQCSPEIQDRTMPP